MNTIKDWFDDDEGRNGVERYLWAMVLGLLKEIGEELAEELAAGLSEYLRESKTPNGWTEDEFLSYAIGRLTALKEQKIGPYIVDTVLDMGIESLVKYLTGRMGETPPPVDTPEPPVDPYFPTTYGPDDEIDHDRLFDGDLIYKDGMSRFVIPGRFRNHQLYVMAAQGATLITIIGSDN